MYVAKRRMILTDLPFYSYCLVQVKGTKIYVDNMDDKS